MIDPKAARAWATTYDPPFPSALDEPLGPLPPSHFDTLRRVVIKAQAYINSIQPFLEANWEALNKSLAREIEQFGHEPIDTVSPVWLCPFSFL